MSTAPASIEQITAEHNILSPKSRWVGSRVASRLTSAFYVFSAVQFVYAYAAVAYCYVPLGQYLAGRAGLPFQRRVMAMFLLKLLLHLHLPFGTSGPNMLDGVPRLYLLVIDVAGFGAAAWFALRLHSKVAPGSQLHFLVYPILLFTACWTYLTNYTVNCLYYPWDMLSMGFFTAGVYFIYTRRFYPLLLIILVGTFNRESTLFLIPIFLLDALAPSGEVRSALNTFRRVPWLKAFLLAAAWLLVRFILGHFYRNNSHTDDFIRLRYNLRYLNPRMWPQILGAGGYTFLTALILWKRIPDRRLRAYILVVPLWFLTMCFYGVLAETRIYGELCPLVAVLTTMLIGSFIGSTRTVASSPVAFKFDPALNAGQARSHVDLHVEHPV